MKRVKMYALLMLDDWFQHQTTNKKAAKIAYFVVAKCLSRVRWDHSSLFDCFMKEMCPGYENGVYDIKPDHIFDAWWTLSETEESWFKRDTNEAARIIYALFFDTTDERQYRIHNRIYQLAETWLWGIRDLADGLSSPVTVASYEDLQAHNLWFGGEEEEYADAVVELYLYPDEKTWPELVAKYPTDDYVWLVRGVFWEPHLDQVCHKGVTILDRSTIIQQMIRNIGYDDGLQSVFARTTDELRELQNRMGTSGVKNGTGLPADSGDVDRE